jgi:hypothetical protein
MNDFSFFYEFILFLLNELSFLNLVLLIFNTLANYIDAKIINLPFLKFSFY